MAWVMRYRWSRVVLCLLTLCLVQFGSAVAGNVTGWTAQRIEYSRNGARVGEYRQTGPGQWTEFTADGRQIRFRETGRDDWNVYLDDASRGLRIQIDLRTRQIFYTDQRTARRRLYDVHAMYAGADTRRGSGGCRAALQGRIAWDYQGNRRWEEENMSQLCGGNEGSAEPARCFQRVMFEGIDWGGGTQWEWPNAIALCQGARRADARIGCFVDLIDQGYGWEEAIQNCAYGRGR